MEKTINEIIEDILLNLHKDNIKTVTPNYDIGKRNDFSIETKTRKCGYDEPGGSGILDGAIMGGALGAGIAVFGAVIGGCAGAIALGYGCVGSGALIGGITSGTLIGSAIGISFNEKDPILSKICWGIGGLIGGSIVGGAVGGTVYGMAKGVEYLVK